MLQVHLERAGGAVLKLCQSQLKYIISLLAEQDVQLQHTKMEAAVIMPGYELNRQGRVQGLMGTVMQQLRGEALGTGSIPMNITDTGNIFVSAFSVWFVNCIQTQVISGSCRCVFY